jgi:hypothetical protein
MVIQKFKSKCYFIKMNNWGANVVPSKPRVDESSNPRGLER